MKSIRSIIAACCLVSLTTALHAATPDFNADIAPLFQKYCNGCHDEREANGELVLTNFEKTMAGGENGPVIVAGKLNESRLLLLITGKDEPVMPPEGNKGPTADEIALIRQWIEGGAPTPTKPLIRKLANVPEIKPTGDVRAPIASIAHAPNGKWMAIARYGSVEVFSMPDLKRAHLNDSITGNVNDIGFSKDGSIYYTAAGEAGFYGQLTLFESASGKLIRRIEGHLDSLYSAAISPDGKHVATGSYDQSIFIWNTDTGEQQFELVGHNGPIYDLEFHPTLPILLSASGDRTVKLWSTETGERLDTLNQPEKEQYSATFSPDGKYIAGAGVDRRIRIWEITKQGEENTNPLIYSRFAHEKPILRVAFSPDGAVLVSASEDRLLKFWETSGFTQTGLSAVQPDWPSAVSFNTADKELLVGRMDGSLTTYPVLEDYARNSNSAEPITLVRAPVPMPNAEPAPATLKLDEKEPNDSPDEAMPISYPVSVSGILKPSAGHSEDHDYYRLSCNAGESVVIETRAEQDKSPADTLVEVFHADTREPVLRYLLQAKRDSYINFRGLNSDELQVRVKNWEEMGLNQYLYLNGEIGRVIRMPLGPDSGLLLYSVGGKRRAYFDTTAFAHPNEEPAYIVEAYPPDAQLVDNGLPVFPLYYANDDDGRRVSGRDSRIMFTAPKSGEYLVRVKDTRGFGGDDFKYELTIRTPQPDFNVSIGGKGAKIEPGGAVKLTFTADRRDDFEDEIAISVEGLPEGFTCSAPTRIETGHVTADVVVAAEKDAAAPSAEQWKQVRVTARATIRGEEVVKELGDLGEFKFGDAPRAILHLVLPEGAEQLKLAPGGQIRALLKVERFEGFDGELRCDVHNLPHGVIVDDIGLSGVMIRAGETERMIFLSATDWVEDLQRNIFAGATGNYTVKVKDKDGKEKNETRNINQMSRPLTLTVGGEASP